MTKNTLILLAKIFIPAVMFLAITAGFAYFTKTSFKAIQQGDQIGGAE